jgi:hypothetical protein
MNAIGIDHQRREPDQLLAEYNAIVSNQQRAHADEFRQFLAGARAALAWVLGRVAAAPASGHLEPATVAAMRREERLCDRIIYSGDLRPALDPDFANGIEHALSWARGAEDVPPTPLDLASAPAARLCACR